MYWPLADRITRRVDRSVLIQRCHRSLFGAALNEERRSDLGEIDCACRQDLAGGLANYLKLCRTRTGDIVRNQIVDLARRHEIQRKRTIVEKNLDVSQFLR